MKSQGRLKAKAILLFNSINYLFSTFYLLVNQCVICLDKIPYFCLRRDTLM